MALLTSLPGCSKSIFITFLLVLSLPMLPGDTRAQDLGYSYEPELERDEARRMIPDPSKLRDIALDEISIPYRAQRKRQRNLSELLAPGEPGKSSIRIMPLEGYLDMDNEDQIIYGPSRTRLKYGEIFIEADKLILDMRLEEIQTEGNVILRMNDSEVNADSLRFNYGTDEGVAFNAQGNIPPVYFSSALRPGDELSGEPQLLKVSPEESIFRNTRATACDFSTPHYYFRGNEIILFENDRIFIRGATFYIWGVPSFYLPVYSRSLYESSPWFMHLGSGSRTGTRVRLGYEYKHRIDEPALEDETEMITRTGGTARIFVDYLSRLGGGSGLDYQYSVEYDKHHGGLRIYGLHDDHRRVVGENLASSELQDEASRWAVNWKHRSEITDELSLLVNMDHFSDPDIFHDVLDLWSDEEEDRERVVERESKVALTLNRDAWLIRIMARMRDRIGLDRVNDYSDPRDNNRDFDLDPFTTLGRADSDGISSRRWGHVSRKLPHITAATRWLRPGKTPLYYSSELHLYNSLDKGINIISKDDDAFVKGVETYHSLLYQWKLARRYTLLARIGAGVGGSRRDRGLDLDFPEGTLFPATTDALTFADPDTWVTGTRKRSLEDIENAYSWADSSLQMNARFSDALTGFLRWRYRHTTDDFIGDFYRSLGDLTNRHDLFNYKLREHWVDYNLVYRLLHPILTLYTRGGVNLQGSSHLYSKEPIARFIAGSRWDNQSRTVSTDLYVGGTRVQTYDPSDSREYVEHRLLAGLELGLTPIHNRWHALIEVKIDEVQDSRTERRSDSSRTFFTDEDHELDIDLLFARELGPKWNTEVEVEWEQDQGGLNEVSWKLERDLHDAIGVLRVTVERDEEDAEDRNDNSETEVDVELGLKMKLPAHEIDIGSGTSSVLASETREPSLAY